MAPEHSISTPEHDFDLAIIGSGSGNSLVTEDFAGKKVAIIESGIFGGTCLNVGCIPTKMYVYVANVAHSIRDASRYGIDATLDQVRWADIRDRIFNRIDPISAGGKKYRREGPVTTLFDGHAGFLEPHRLRVTSHVGADAEFSAAQIVIATGAHPVVPDVIAASGVPFHTSDTVMRLETLPARMMIVGGGYIAAEMASVFGAFGCAITLINRGSVLLREQDADISAAFTAYASGACDVRLNTTISSLTDSGAEITAKLSDGSTVSADVLLVAAGRYPNTARLGADKAGVAIRDDGRVEVDCYGRTTVAGVWSLGDVSSAYQLKHVANHEARVVAHNLAHPTELTSFDHRYVPAAVFSNPEIAHVGLTERAAHEKGLDYVTAIQNYGDTAFGWAMEDKTGICKVIADRSTGKLLGAHIMGHEASVLIQPLIQALSFEQSVREVATKQYWIHPALSEVVENALLKLDLG